MFCYKTHSHALFYLILMTFWLLKVDITNIFPLHMGKDVNRFEETGMGLWWGLEEQLMFI